MNEHHHLELLTIDYDMLDILSVPYSSPIVINGKWRVPVTKFFLFMTQDELLAFKERAIKELLFLEGTGEIKQKIYL